MNLTPDFDPTFIVVLLSIGALAIAFALALRRRERDDQGKTPAQLDQEWLDDQM